MKTVATIVFSLWIIGCTSESPTEGLSFPLKSPKNISVEHFSILDYPDGNKDRTKEIFISDGKMWRLELEKPGKVITVILFDGKEKHTNSNKAIPDAVYDWRKHFEKLYENLNSKNYVALEDVGRFSCWCFTLEEKGTKADVWVDSKLSIPRKWSIQHANGEKEIDYFFDYTKPKIESRSLFDASNVKPNLIDSMASDWDDLY